LEADIQKLLKRTSEKTKMASKEKFVTASTSTFSTADLPGDVNGVLAPRELGEQ
jgi:hypothetical protein